MMEIIVILKQILSIIFLIAFLFICRKINIEEEQITNKDLLAVILAGVLMLLMVSCAAPELNKERIKSLEIHTSPEIGFMYSIDEGVTDDPEFWGKYLDEQAKKWNACMTETYNKHNVLNSNLLLSWRIVFVEGTFRCGDGNCHGQVNNEGDGLLIFIGVYEGFEEREYGLCDGMTPALCHELSHTCPGSNDNGICLRSDHSNIEELKECI